MLVNQLAVQRDLGIGLGIREKVIEINRECERELQLLNTGQTPFTQGRQKIDEQCISEIQEHLTADQWRRINQIARQSLGVSIFTDSEVAAELNLTDEQRQKVVQINRDYLEKRRGNRLPGGFGVGPDGNREEANGKLNELNAKQKDDLHEVLTDEQRLQLAEMLGQDFDVTQLRATAAIQFGIVNSLRSTSPDKIRQIASNEKVHEDLKLTEAETGRLNELVKNWVGRLTQLQTELREKLAADQNAAAERGSAKLPGVLNADQMARLEQIRLQCLGIQIYFDPVVVKALSISPDQFKTLTSINETAAAATNQLGISFRGRGGGGGGQTAEDRAANIKKRDEINRQRKEDLLAALSDEQRRKLDEMQGRQFTTQFSTLATAEGFLNVQGRFHQSLKNAGFESGDDDWTAEGFGRPSIVQVDANESHEGRHSMMISASQPADASIYQEMQLGAGVKYRCRGWVKTQDLDPKDAAVFGTIQIQSPSGSQIVASGPNLQGTNDWTEISFLFDAPNTSRYRVEAFLIGYGRGTGVAWFDEITVSEVSPAELVDMAFAENQPFEFDYSLDDIAGTPITKSEYAGKVLIVNIWNSGNLTCRNLVRDLIRLQKDYATADLAIVGLNLESGNTQQLQRVRQYYEQTQINYPCALVTNEFVKTIPDFKSCPTTLVLDRNGKVRAKLVGNQRYEVLELIIKKLLAE